MSEHELTHYLNTGAAGDAEAAENAFRLVYDRLRLIASSGRGGPSGDGTLNPTALVHEAYLKMFRSNGAGWNDRHHFYSVAATAMRQIAIDHARAALSMKRGGGWKRKTLDDEAGTSEMSPLDILALESALLELAEVAPRQARIVELRYFGGVPVPEIASILGCSRRTVEIEWRTARAWLRGALSEGGEPA